MRCKCLFDNPCRGGDDGVSSGRSARAGDYTGTLVPFGSNVCCTPTTERTRAHNIEDPRLACVFAGCETTPGYGWSGTRLIWILEDFNGVDLHQRSDVINRQQIMPHLVKKLVIAEEGIVFPLKAKYTKS